MRRPSRFVPVRTQLTIALLGLILAVLAPLTASVAALPTDRQTAADDVMLADFETADALEGTRVPTPDLDSVDTSDRLASQGKRSMQFDVGGFESKTGKGFPRVWLNAGTTLPDVDWTSKAYLHLGISNASSERIQMYVTVWDRNDNHLVRSMGAEPYEHQVFQIETATLSDGGIELSQIDKVQISTERSPDQRRMYVDDIRLTDQRADIPAERSRVAGDLVGLMKLERKLADRTEALRDVSDRIRPAPARPDTALANQAESLQSRLDDYRAQLPTLGNKVAKARKVWSGIRDLRWQIFRLSSSVDARAARPESPIGLGFADSMSRVYPRDLPCPCTYEQVPKLDMARGEHESAQLVALPYDRALPDAKVQATIAKGPSDDLRVDAHPVAALDMSSPVEQRPATPTQFRPSRYKGWTPDPIQSGKQQVDVATGDLQAFWIALRTTPETEPGVYQVTLTLTADGLESQQVRLPVSVSDVEVPRKPKLRTAIGHDPQAYAEPYGVTDPNQVEKLVEQEYDFLGDYLLQGDNIYRSVYENNPPSVQSLRRIQREHGGLRQFNIWYFDPREFDLEAPETWAASTDDLFDRIEPYVEKYRAAGFLDKAYLYCCDETGTEYTDLIEFVLTRFEKRFPDVEVLTTAIDDQMGRATGLDELMDWWVRDVPWYDPEVITERHDQGNEAWWYVHQANADPTPNVFVNYDPIQLRVLLGPMSHQADIDGFLYYRVDRWYGKDILDDGPLSSWDPRTFDNWAGDGSLFYPGPDGPIPSIRLENIRDGLEDYNLLWTLEQAIESAPPDTDGQLLKRANELLDSTEVVTDNYQYVRAPDDYRAWRSDVLAVIVALGRG